MIFHALLYKIIQLYTNYVNPNLTIKSRIFMNLRYKICSFVTGAAARFLPERKKRPPRCIGRRSDPERVRDRRYKICYACTTVPMSSPWATRMMFSRSSMLNTRMQGILCSLQSWKAEASITLRPRSMAS